VVLVLIPGPAVLYIVSTGIGRGRKMALASMLGIEVGTLFHVAAASLGLSAIVASSTIAYSVVKYAGAAYLIYLGIKTLRSRGEDQIPEDIRNTSARSAFGRGVMVNFLNPKIALFFLAFLPQFVAPSRGSVSGQVLTLGLLFVVVAIIIDSAYALASGSIGSLLHRSPRMGSWRRRISGVTYLALGATAAVTGSGQK
jgi:threonine/homoserine/homoserine lactone efflux protein